MSQGTSAGLIASSETSCRPPPAAGVCRVCMASGGLGCRVCLGFRV